MREVNGWEDCGGVVWFLFVFFNEEPHGGRLTRGRSWLSLTGGLQHPFPSASDSGESCVAACSISPFSEAQEL